MLLVEVAAGRLDRVTPDGRVDLVAELGGGPNGAAIGPDGIVYVWNNGGGAVCEPVDGRAHVGLDPARYVGGSIQVSISPTGATAHSTATATASRANICFGGADRRTVWITAAGTGRLLRTEWPRAGLPLAFEA